MNGLDGTPGNLEECGSKPQFVSSGSVKRARSRNVRPAQIGTS